MKVYLDFDDYYPRKTSTEKLLELHRHFPNFKVNIFTIWQPDLLKDDFLHQEWVLPCLHGVKHTINEEINFRELMRWPYAKIYRAPFWGLTKEMYLRLILLGWKVMLNPERQDEKRKGIYFNWNIKDFPPKDRAILIGHGHLTDYDNGIGRCMEQLKSLPKDTEFGFLTELDNRNRGYYSKLGT